MHPKFDMLTTEGDMDISEMILAEVKHTRAEQAELRKELKNHIDADQVRLDKIKDRLHCLSTQSALTKQQQGFITAFISLVVAGVVSVVVAFVGNHNA